MELDYIIVGGSILLVILIVVLVFLLLYVLYYVLYVKRNRPFRAQTREIRRKMKAVQSAIRRKIEPDEKAIRKLAEDPETRNLLYQLFAENDLVDKFPTEYRTREKFAESDLVVWLGHPKELRGSPDEIEFVEAVRIDSETEAGKVVYYLFKYRNDHPHRGYDKGWMAGVSGPYPDDESLPLGVPFGTFSELEPFDRMTPQEHVEYYHKLALDRGVYKETISFIKSQND